ncbi:MAG TPA: Do family serine endopeptidase [Gammaproteobacteria bacterium]|nr:Do family serine endopeptidase [Gammaproteobacteria bacterium]
MTAVESRRAFSENAERAQPPRSMSRLAHPLLFAVLCCPALALAQLPSSRVPTLAPMIERVSPTVVNISVSGEAPADNPLSKDPLFRYFFPDQPEKREVQASGSGVIVDAQKGYILTNDHVIENADKITVTLLDNRSMDAHVIGTDEGTDLAVLQVQTQGLTAIPFGDSDRLRVGDFVVAIGNPFGFSHTVTSGIVSGLGRTGINPDAFEDFIQTDASINPGNSGGALVDLNGNLIGINSAIISRGGGSIGIGFAIPVNMARGIMKQLIEYGKVSRGLLGVKIQSVTPDIAQTYGLGSASGALVMSVSPNSAAEKAGIEVADVIVSVNDHAVPDSGSLKAAIGLERPGTHVKVGFVRDGRLLMTAAELGQAASAQAEPAPEAPPKGPKDSALDPALQGAELAKSDRARSASAAAGLYVVSVEDGSPAAIRGLQAGDVITRINRQRVRSVDDARRVLEGAEAVILEVQRNGRGMLLLMR